MLIIINRVGVCVGVLKSAEEKVPVWYIMDEFGSRVQHSSQPSCCMAPLFYAPQQIAYSVLWPLQDLESGGTHCWDSWFIYYFIVYVFTLIYAVDDDKIRLPLTDD